MQSAPPDPLQSALVDVEHSLPLEDAWALRALLNRITAKQCLNDSAKPSDRGTLLSVLRYFAAGHIPGILAGGLWSELPGGLDILRAAQGDIGDPCAPGRRPSRAPSDAVRQKMTEPSFVDAISQLCHRPLAVTGDPVYLFYDGQSGGIPPHADRSEFSYNLLAVIEHSVQRGHPESMLKVWSPENGESEIVPLPVGRWIFFDAGATVHGRSDPGDGERVTVVSVGLLPVERETAER